MNHKRKYRCELFHNDEVGKVKDIIDLSILYILDTVIYHRNIEKLQKISLFNNEKAQACYWTSNSISALVKSEIRREGFSNFFFLAVYVENINRK